MEVIHKKSGRLHIYVRQDKYKGELKSKNWVGRVYIHGKQKIFSSGTTNIDEAIPILEEWFDKLFQENEKSENNIQPTIEKETNDLKAIETSSLSNDNNQEKIINLNKDQTEAHSEINQSTSDDKNQSFFQKLKKIKISDISFKKNIKDSGANQTKTKFKSIFSNFFQSKVSKLSVSSEEIFGLDISRDAIRVAQVSKNKFDKWTLDKFSYRFLDSEKIGDNLFDNKDYLSEEISLALANARISTTNVAFSIPFTSAIIQVVTSPLMNEQELKKAIDTQTLWENLIQLTDDLNDYSIFHQVINRNTKNNTMDILFVASKLADINAFSSIVKKANLNPVIMDVKCFTLKNAFDNLVRDKSEITGSAIMDFGIDENYLMIIHNNMPIITDLFLTPQEKKILSTIESNLDEECKNVLRRASMQAKQAINEYEGKYEAKINKIYIVCSIKNSNQYLNEFKKNIENTDIKIFDPLSDVTIPKYNVEKTNLNNKSPITSVLGLAFRKLDVFGYYKFVTAVKNINLLPNREAIKQKNKIKFLSGYAFTGLISTIIIIYSLMIGFSGYKYYSNKEKLLSYEQIQEQHLIVSKRIGKLTNKEAKMEQSLQLGNNIISNQVESYIALNQIARSVPARVKFSKIDYDGNNRIIINGFAYDHQDIINFNINLNKKKLIKKAEIISSDPTSSEELKASSMKRTFLIKCIIDVSLVGKGT